jgi:sporulation protein YlmC with PRC-barrel domain
LALALLIAPSLAEPVRAQVPETTVEGEREAEPIDALQAGIRTISIHSLLELDVVTADGEDLGEVYDLVVDPTDGLMKFLVVERSEAILGIFRRGETRVAVPWHRVFIEEAPRRFRVDMTLEDFEAMPTWEGERTESGGVGAAPMDDRPDQPPLASD